MLAIQEYILLRYNLVVARNTTFEIVSCKINEYFVFDNTLYICVDGLNKYEIETSTKMYTPF